jgi:hypothetical protein
LTTNYDLPYALWIALKLIGQLSARPVGAALRARIAQAGAALRDRLAREAKRRYLNPQDAALLTLACLDDTAAEAIFEPDWIATLLKNQRYDGSWQGQPFYPTPHRGGVAVWYASRTVTTAFCYHALQTYRGRRP